MQRIRWQSAKQHTAQVFNFVPIKTTEQQAAYPHLLTIPGVGPAIAAAFLSEVDAEQFANGRQLSAWCGLVLW
ncbi:transposase [Pectobacterium sp. A5351]|nr:transposase [Pectobacterium sp. A5351]WCG84013.1 transposase [Pectobacterium sp. A5351]